jgi:nitrogenase-associated protein
MAVISFFEKPGCANNTRQKRILAAAGHVVVARSLLAEAWTAERLQSFFAGRPVAEWFNRAAPRVKSGEVVPEVLAADAALALMLADPLLIRRPLMEVDGQRMAGFDQDLVHAWVGLSPNGDLSEDVQSCRKDPARDRSGCNHPTDEETR